MGLSLSLKSPSAWGHRGALREADPPVLGGADPTPMAPPHIGRHRPISVSATVP